MRCKSVMRACAVGLLVGAGCTMGQAAVAAPAHDATPASTGRHVTDLGTGWRFRFGGDSVGTTDPSYDDRAWSIIDLPHTWNHLGNYSLTRSADSNVEQGVGWYRLHFKAPVFGESRRQVLQFDGVGTIAEVWVNGTRVGEHRGAFSRFRFDITDVLKPGVANIIAVKADNSKPEPGSSTSDIIPLGGDFFVHGGLYRGVSLIDVDSAQIDTLDHGGSGIYLTTPQATSERASIDVLTRLRNFGSAARKLTLSTTIFDADGRSVLTATKPVRLNAGAATSHREVLSLAKPHLWNGRADPYLYRVAVELRDGKRLVDRVEQPLGIRSFRFDPDIGFILNGKPVRLHGVSRHQDMAGKGWALTAQDHATDMAIMAEMGVNTVRHAHYQHAQEWSDLADKYGMVVWAELPFVHESSLTNDAPTAATIENAKSQLTELIRQNYNHPSIMIWSVGNEIDIAAGIEGKGQPAQSLGLLQTLNALAKTEDSTRPTAYADCCEGTPLSVKGAEVLTGTTDIVAFNRYFGWYYATPDMAARALDGFHAKYPKLPIALSEYGAGGALTQHTDNPLGGPINSRSRPHPEEYQSWVHEETWKVLKTRDYLAASWIWNMFDFASLIREEGDAFDLNDKGLVTYDRKTRKDAFYFYKANWSDQPVLHIAGRRYADRAYSVIDIRAYSNADRAALTLNGVSVGTAACPDRICEWHNVTLKMGRNLATVTATVGGDPQTDSVTWIGPDATKGIAVDAGTLTGRIVTDGTRYGSDNFFTGGTAKELNKSGFTRVPANPKVVTGNEDPALYASYREGSFRYDIPLPDGTWQVTLHMMEPDAALATTRTFDVSANGAVALRAYNPASAAGGALKMVAMHFPATVKGGLLKLDFVPRGGPALVVAISVKP